MISFTTMIQVDKPVDVRVGGITQYDLARQLFKCKTGKSAETLMHPLACDDHYLALTATFNKLAEVMRECVYSAYKQFVSAIRFYSYPVEHASSLSLIAVCCFEACPGGAIFVEDMGLLTYFAGEFEWTNTQPVREKIFSELDDELLKGWYK